MTNAPGPWWNRNPSISSSSALALRNLWTHFSFTWLVLLLLWTRLRCSCRLCMQQLSPNWPCISWVWVAFPLSCNAWMHPICYVSDSINNKVIDLLFFQAITQHLATYLSQSPNAWFSSFNWRMILFWNSAWQECTIGPLLTMGVFGSPHYIVLGLLIALNS